MIQARSDEPALEYRFLKFDTHSKAEKGLNDAIAEGWQLVTYQAAGDSTSVTHFVVVSRTSQPESRRFGFGA
ncbi:MAG: hypothetical protein GEU75_07955 [Dehalococcoidia bacterium]|nr:hypothetical protein [Dehalococcoidia bacterium]